MMITSEKAWGSKASLAIALAVMLGITGCGGSSSSGGGTPDSGGDGDGNGNGGGPTNEQPANIQSEDDAKLGADAAVESARQAIILEDSPGGEAFPSGATITEQTHHEWLLAHSLELVDTDPLPTAAGIVNIDQGNCGGDVTAEFNESAERASFYYNDYCLTDGNGRRVMNGTQTFFGFNNVDTEESWRYDFDYTITYQGETEHVQGSYTCNGNGITGCSYSNNYEGRNGRSYRSENVSVSESNGNYDVSARVYDEDIGYVDYQASNLVLCEGGYGFSSGTITVSDEANNEVLTITFSGCDSFTMTYQGAGYTINY